VRNDKITIDEIKELNPDKIVLSPGPKAPKDAGICIDVIKSFYKIKPILGICLGHQAIGEAFGATVSYAKEVCHGVDSNITITGGKLFEGIPRVTKVARYHSLAVEDGFSNEQVKDILEYKSKLKDYLNFMDGFFRKLLYNQRT